MATNQPFYIKDMTDAKIAGARHEYIQRQAAARKELQDTE